MDGEKLVSLAKESISSYFENKTPDLSDYSNFSTPQGVFVTLKKEGKLKGCVGFPQAIYQLNEAVVKAARAAAFEDTRFSSLQKKEIKDIEIEISVLSIPKKVVVKNKEDYLKKIKIGVDGLIVKTSFTQGLLLPQVATEWNFSELDFLEAACEKADLPKNAWKEKEVELYTFQAQIFSEKNGRVIESK